MKVEGEVVGKNHENLEFTMLAELERLQQKYPDIPEIQEMRIRWRKWLNENSASILQYAHAYAFMSGFDSMDVETRDMVKSITEAMLKRVNTADEAFASLRREPPAAPGKVKAGNKR